MDYYLVALYHTSGTPAPGFSNGKVVYVSSLSNPNDPQLSVILQEEDFYEWGAHACSIASGCSPRDVNIFKVRLWATPTPTPSPSPSPTPSPTPTPTPTPTPQSPNFSYYMLNYTLNLSNLQNTDRLYHIGCSSWMSDTVYNPKGNFLGYGTSCTPGVRVINGTTYLVYTDVAYAMPDSPGPSDTKVFATSLVITLALTSTVVLAAYAAPTIVEAAGARIGGAAQSVGNWLASGTARLTPLLADGAGVEGSLWQRLANARWSNLMHHIETYWVPAARSAVQRLGSRYAWIEDELWQVWNRLYNNAAPAEVAAQLEEAIKGLFSAGEYVPLPAILGVAFNQNITAYASPAISVERTASEGVFRMFVPFESALNWSSESALALIPLIGASEDFSKILAHIESGGEYAISRASVPDARVKMVDPSGYWTGVSVKAKGGELPIVLKKGAAERFGLEKIMDKHLNDFQRVFGLSQETSRTRTLQMIFETVRSPEAVYYNGLQGSYDFYKKFPGASGEAYVKVPVSRANPMTVGITTAYPLPVSSEELSSLESKIYLQRFSPADLRIKLPDFSVLSKAVEEAAKTVSNNRVIIGAAPSTSSEAAVMTNEALGYSAKAEELYAEGLISASEKETISSLARQVVDDAAKSLVQQAENALKATRSSFFRLGGGFKGFVIAALTDPITWILFAEEELQGTLVLCRNGTAINEYGEVIECSVTRQDSARSSSSIASASDGSSEVRIDFYTGVESASETPTGKRLRCRHTDTLAGASAGAGQGLVLGALAVGICALIPGCFDAASAAISKVIPGATTAGNIAIAVGATTAVGAVKGAVFDAERYYETGCELNPSCNSGDGVVETNACILQSSSITSTSNKRAVDAAGFNERIVVKPEAALTVSTVGILNAPEEYMQPSAQPSPTAEQNAAPSPDAGEQAEHLTAVDSNGALPGFGVQRDSNLIQAPR